MKILKCPSCGANVKENKSVCEYCGCVFEINDNKQKTVKQPEVEQQVKPEIFNETTKQEIGDLTFNIEKLSWGIICVICIICWPVGLFFAIIKLNKDKNKQ